MVGRAQARLGPHQGDSAQAVAQRLSPSRRANYKILERYPARSDRPVVERIGDQSRPGRPADKRHQVAQVNDSPSRLAENQMCAGALSLSFIHGQQ
jgi:hypothetical protein